MMEKKIAANGETWCGDTTHARRMLESVGVACDWIDID
jgi:hypothetical protein